MRKRLRKKVLKFLNGELFVAQAELLDANVVPNNITLEEICALVREVRQERWERKQELARLGIEEEPALEHDDDGWKRPDYKSVGEARIALGKKRLEIKASRWRMATFVKLCPDGPFPSMQEEYHNEAFQQATALANERFPGVNLHTDR